MTSLSWLDEQIYWIFDGDTDLSEAGSSGDHQIIGNVSSPSIFDPLCRESNDISSRNIFDSDYEKLDELFMLSGYCNFPEFDGSENFNEQSFRADHSEPFEVGTHGGREIDDDFSGFNLDMVFDKLIEMFQGSYDSELCEVGSSGGYQVNDLYSGNNFDPVFGNLSEHFLWVDNDDDDDDDDEKERDILILQSGKEHDVKKINDRFRELTCEHVELDPVFGNLSEHFLWVDVDVDDDDDDEKERDILILQSGKEHDVTKINDRFRELTCEHVEPGAQEKEDVYTVCRGEAIKMMRIASSLTKAKKEAYSRGEHTSAKQLAVKASKAWKDAYRLNAEAAIKILKINNKKNGLMKLDLHGLHLQEAKQAVKKRLHVIETKPEACNTGKPRCLQVITGVGKHSRGEPKLPKGVRNFLANEGYKFDEGRPGVIMVRPKFRAS